MFVRHDYSPVMLLYRRAALACPELVKEILTLRIADFGLEPNGERGLPGDPAFRKNGWWHYMLARYFFAGSLFCRNKRVLELCSGLGWGARIISHYAAEVTGLELDAEVVDRAGKMWAGSESLRFISGDALAASEQARGAFDVVLGMEAIEHFTRDDACRLIGQAHNLLAPAGVFIASSYYADTREQAERALTETNNPYHLYLFTKEEIGGVCAGLFPEVHIYGDLLLLAGK
ncbi:MAG: methyltransferase domain-containing protein [Deltaproteobacteria bacterium]|jgi:SAM-dependent methyltransferase|nr:methyltransferase domain-containing protein [Deltaproteobacteria bacterium]